MPHTAHSLECPNCQTQNPEAKKFCRECGAKLSQVCPQCGSQSLPVDKFCGECGHKFAGKEKIGRAKPATTVLSMNKRLPVRRRFPDLRADLIDKETAIEKAEGNGICQTIAICNQKGGVGKTVTAINLSAGMAARGLRTLLIDFDPQGQSGLGLGMDIDCLEHSVYDVLVNGTCPAREAIVPLGSNLDILPSTIDLARAELELGRFQKRERRLKELIEGLKTCYEYVVIDCPPSIGTLTINALVASQIVIIPVTPSYLSICDLSRVMGVLEALKDSLLLDVTILFLITLFERRHREARIQKRNLERTHGQHLLKTVVRKNTKLNTATRKGVSIFEYDRDCPGSQDYADLAEEILSIEYEENRVAEKGMLRRSVLLD